MSGIRRTFVCIRHGRPATAGAVAVNGAAAARQEGRHLHAQRVRSDAAGISAATARKPASRILPNYDDAVLVEGNCENGWIMVQDTALWDGYEDIPPWIIQGYAARLPWGAGQ